MRRPHQRGPARAAFALLAALTVPLAAAGCAQPRTCDASPTARYYARAIAPCGRELLEIAERPEGPFRAVQPVGPNRPAARLRYHALLAGRFIVRGRLTGRNADDGHCGAYPELVVEDFGPWGPVVRTFSAGSLDGQLHLHTEPLPTDRFVPADFEGGPELPLLDGDRCVAAAACHPGWLWQRNADGRRLCCPRL